MDEVDGGQAIEVQVASARQFKPGAAHTYQPYEDLVYSAFDPLLTVSGELVGFIADQPSISTLEGRSTLL